MYMNNASDLVCSNIIHYLYVCMYVCIYHYVRTCIDPIYIVLCIMDLTCYCSGIK